MVKYEMDMSKELYDLGASGLAKVKIQSQIDMSMVRYIKESGE